VEFKQNPEFGLWIRFKIPYGTRVGQQWSENNFEELNHFFLQRTLEHIGKNLATYSFNSISNIKYLKTFL
jgi:hypothetical protein